MSKHHAEDVPEDVRWFALPFAESPTGAHRKPERLPSKQERFLDTVAANVQARERRFTPSPHASLAAAIMQQSGKRWNLEWDN